VGGAEPCGRGAAEKGEPEPKAEKSGEGRRGEWAFCCFCLLLCLVFGSPRLRGGYRRPQIDPKFLMRIGL
jgi:hypothetical protein